MIKTSNNKPIGRFYFRKFNFNSNIRKIDWELNILIADPLERGKGLGTASQKLIIDYLMKLEETNSIFAYTMKENIAERKSLEKVGFKLYNDGLLPSSYYKIDLNSIDPEKFVIYFLKETDD